MSMVKKSITITEQQDEWIKTQIESGHYGSDSEVLRDLIRHAQTRHDDIEAIRAALLEGEESGLSDRTPEQIWNAVAARKRGRGHL